MPENTPLYDEMTVRGFLAFLAELRGSRPERDRRVDGILDKCMLSSVRNQTIDTLSKGYAGDLAGADVLTIRPSSAGRTDRRAESQQKQVVREMIDAMARTRSSCVHHVLEEVEACASRVMIISKAR
jgi:ABC-2 type transport system ATP-binding protein